MTIELQLLGGFGASEGGRPIDGLRAAGPSRLLAYLALHRNTRARRLYLAALFWPDRSDVRARRRLSHNLWVLQTALAPVNPSLIQADRDTIGIHPDADLWIDAEVFEQQIDEFEMHRRGAGGAHVQGEALEHSLQLYQGDLLSDHYDEWIEPIRLRLREKYLLGLRHLVGLQKSRGAYGAALLSARQLVSETPLAEQAHGELMRLYWLAGRADEAIAQHQICTQILAEELGVEPSDELNSLKARIVAQRRPTGGTATRPATRPVGTAQDTMVGRADARRRVLDVVDSAFGGTGGFVLVEGQPGMGKTTLLGNVAEAARWRGASVVWSRSLEHQQLEPYQALTRGLSPVLQGLRREQVVARLDRDVISLAALVLPSLDEGAPHAGGSAGWKSPDERWRVQAAITQVVLTLGEVSPTTLILDDLQWCDAESLEFLKQAAPLLVNTQVAVVLSYRTQEARNRQEVWTLLTDIEMRHPVTRVTLGGLDHEEIASLARARSNGDVSPEMIDQLEQATGGNPLFVIETMRAIEHSEDAEGGQQLAERLGIKATADRISEVLLREISTASAEVQSVVGALSIWGAPASSGVLSRLTYLDMRETLDSIREGIAAEFITEKDGSYALRFDQLASAASSRLTRAETKQFNLRCAEVRVEDPLTPASELAAHYRAAELWPEAARFEMAAAARAASLHSYETAVRYYELALASLEQAGEVPSIGLLFGFEDVLDTLGRRDDQAEILTALEESPGLTVLNRIRTLERRAMFLANTDDFAAAIRTGCTAVGFAVASGIAVTPYLVSLARVFIMAGHPDLARRHLEGLVDEGATSASLARAHLVLGQALTDAQDLSEAETQLQAALDLFRTQQDSRGQVEALAAFAVLESQSGDTTTALRHYAEAIGLARQIGNRFGEAMALANQGLLNYIIGNPAAALDDMRAAIDGFLAIGHRRGEAIVRANSASILHSVIGDDVLAEREATLARRYFEEIGDHRHVAQCLDVLGGIRRRRRAYAVSRKLLTGALGKLESTGDAWLEVQVRRSLAWNEREAGNTADALDILAKAIVVAEEHATTLELPSLLALEAVVLLDAGMTEEAAAAARRSLELTERGSEMQHNSAWWRSTVFDALGDATRAQDDLQTAHGMLVELLAPFSDEQRKMSLSKVAEHRAIAEAFAGQFPRTYTARLAAAQNPTGGPSIDVTLTVHHPDDLCVQDKKERRKQRLVRILSEARIQGAHARIEDLADALDASVSTLKRDLASLRADGALP